MVKTQICEPLARSQKSPQNSPESGLHTIVETCSKPSKRGTINRKGKYDICCAAFGAYILTKDIFERIEFAIKERMYNNKGEIDLTDAFNDAITNQNLIGYVIDGESFDLGNAGAYLYTISNYNKK